MEPRSGGGRRRVFSAEFKLEAVRRMEERRSHGVNLTQIGRELRIRPDQLREWKRQHNQRAGAAPADVFPGQGKLPSEQEELRRLQHEVAFRKSAAYFAREAR